MAFWAKVVAFWKKFYLWIALGAVLILLALLFFRRGGSVTDNPPEIKALEGAIDSIKSKIQAADNEAKIKIIKAKATEDTIKAQVDKIEELDDEYEKAKLLADLYKIMDEQ